MKRVLIYGNRKTEMADRVYDVSTESNRKAAFLSLFNYLDKDWQVYHDMNTRHWDLYYKAREGDGKAAIQLLTARQFYEYESWLEVDVVDLSDSESGR